MKPLLVFVPYQESESENKKQLLVVKFNKDGKLSEDFVNFVRGRELTIGKEKSLLVWVNKEDAILCGTSLIWGEVEMEWCWPHLPIPNTKKGCISFSKTRGTKEKTINVSYYSY